MVTRAAASFLAFGLLSLPLNAQLAAQRSDASLAARVDAVFKDFDKPTSPGCAVAAYQDGTIVYRRAYGMANLDHDVPLTPASVFHVASISKQFTAAAILLLEQDGKLSVDDEVRKYIPELPNFGRRITIRHLANHTSGIRDQWALLGLAGWRYSRDLITDDDVLELLSRQKDLNFNPGERHVYSNSGYTLMAIIVARVSGKSFRDFTTERIFKPLGMTNTRFRDNFADVIKNQAYGYAPQRDAFRLSVTNFDTAGATSLLTTVDDMLKWHANFDSATVGGDALKTRLLERGVLNDGRRIEYAFGITHGTYRGLPTIGHGGSDAGYRSAFLRFPEQRFGVATLCNLSTTNPTELSRRVADVYLVDKLKPQTTDALPDDAPEVPLAEQQLKLYAGLYWNREEVSARRVLFDNGRLQAAAGSERIPLKSLGEGRFVMTEGPRLRMAFEANGSTPQLRLGLESPLVFDRAEPFTPTAAQLEEFAGVYRSDEMDAVFRMVLKDGELRLERSKSRPATLEPLVTDTFGAQVGTIGFIRGASGRVSGFVLDAGRLRHVRFWKDTRLPRT
jgi:CubicO group peptidase (beta-lactamase class C family)